MDISRNEEKYPDGIPIKDLVGTEGIIFGFDLETREPVARKYHSVRKTREDASVVKINLEHLHCSGKEGDDHITRIPKEIVVTPDHPVLISTGWGKTSWILASELEPGMRLVADQKSFDCIRGKARHRLIMECFLGRYLEDELIHHKDHCHFNNEIENLEIKNQSSHFSHHQSMKYGYSSSLPSVEELIEMYNSGENFNSLAKKFKCDFSTIESRIGHLVDKRTQKESLLAKPESIIHRKLMKECSQYYQRGYTILELSEFYGVDGTTISQWIIKSGGKVRTSLETKDFRKRVSELPSLNHRVVSVEPHGRQDVYNLEVEDIENFFGNGVVLHNCPKTGQPDFASIEIEYIPRKKCIESKSLKLYLFSYRGHGSFMETITNKILEDLVDTCDPLWMKVVGSFNARGGITTDVVAEYHSKEYRP